MADAADAGPGTRSSAQDILSLATSGTDMFSGGPGELNHIGTVFGGRMIAQALASASRTVDGLPPTSLHSYFVAPASAALSIEYRVERIRDSRRFANRHVNAYQDGKLVFTMMCQFHGSEDGFVHQSAVMPDVPPPEEVLLIHEFVLKNSDRLDEAAMHNFLSPLPIEMRAVRPEVYFFERPETPQRDFWFRLPSAAAIDDLRLQACLLGYCSDYWLAGVAAVPHFFPTNSKGHLISSLDHSIWFHRPARCEDWLLHHTTSPSAQDGLGLSRGQIFDREGHLIASTTQECILRDLTAR